MPSKAAEQDKTLEIEQARIRNQFILDVVRYVSLGIAIVALIMLVIRPMVQRLASKPADLDLLMGLPATTGNWKARNWKFRPNGNPVFLHGKDPRSGQTGSAQDRFPHSELAARHPLMRALFMPNGLTLTTGPSAMDSPEFKPFELKDFDSEVSVRKPLRSKQTVQTDELQCR